MKAQKHVDGHGSPAADDHYRLLQLDPDAPQQLVAEAYWFLAARLRSEMAARRSAERELATLNAAYQVLAVAEQRRIYDATVTRVQETRRQRAERAENLRKRSLRERLFRKAPRREADLYELLRVDPAAEPPLIARAYSILRTIHSKEPAGGSYLGELEQARSTLLDRGHRAAYDEGRAQAAAAMASSSKAEVVPAKKPSRGAVKKEAAVKAAAQELPAEKRAGPDWTARAARALSTSLVVAAKGSGRGAVVAGRLGYRGLTLAAVQGGRGAAAAMRAGGRASQQLRHRESPPRTAGEMPDERLLRDAAPVPAKTREQRAVKRYLGRLVFRNAAAEDEAFELGEEPVTLGSDRECDFRLPAESGAVAPAHAQLWFTGERFVIRSLDPMHPTMLCGQRVNWAGLDDGDEIEIGPHRLRFEAVHTWDAPPDFLTVEEDADDAKEIPERHE